MMELRELSLRLALALALGFVIGLERGWKEREEEEGHRTAGIRTFSLIGLLGGVFGALSLDGDRIVLASGFAVSGAALAAYMWREGVHRKDFSATSLVAAMLTFALGAYSVLGDITAAAGTGVAATILLANKEILHGWVERISWVELRSGLLLAAMTFIALPLLPNRAIDPWDAVNPHQLWLMTILIATLSFAGYVAVKVAGPRLGLTLAAALGGVVSSTAVTLSLARLARDNGGSVKLLAGCILAAGSVMMLRILVVTGLINVPLALVLGPVLLTAAVAQAIAAATLVMSGGRKAGKDATGLEHKNPFLLSEVLRFAILLTMVMLAARFAMQFFGKQGLMTVAAISGLADVDAIALAAARMEGATAAASHAILAAIGVNTLAKSIYAWNAGGRRLGLALLATNALTAAVACGALLLQSAP